MTAPAPADPYRGVPEYVPGSEWTARWESIRGRVIRVTHLSGNYVHYEVVTPSDRSDGAGAGARLRIHRQTLRRAYLRTREAPSPPAPEMGRAAFRRHVAVLLADHDGDDSSMDYLSDLSSLVKRYLWPETAPAWAAGRWKP